MVSVAKIQIKIQVSEKNGTFLGHLTNSCVKKSKLPYYTVFTPSLMAIAFTVVVSLRLNASL